MSLYQVTAIYEDAEIGYGEGEGRAYAINECLDNLGELSFVDARAVSIEVRHNDRKSSMSLAKAQDIVAASDLY